MKLRLLVMGAIITGIGVLLLATRGLVTASVGLPVVGIVLLVLGLLWNSDSKPKSTSAPGAT